MCVAVLTVWVLELDGGSITTGLEVVELGQFVRATREQLVAVLKSQSGMRSALASRPAGW